MLAVKSRMTLGNFRDLFSPKTNVNKKVRALGRILVGAFAVGFVASAFNEFLPFLPKDDVSALGVGGAFGLIVGGAKLAAG